MIVNNLVIPMCITLAVIIAYVTVFTILFRNADEKKKLLPVRIVFYLLIVLEVAKIFYLIAKDGAYYPNRYPIVFCSMVMYAYPIFCFKQNKLSDVAKGFSVIPSILAFIMFASIQWKYNMSLIQVHSYIYHGSMLAVAIYLLTSKLYKFEFKKFYGQFLAVSIYLVSASSISLLIGGPISVFAPTDPYLAFLYNVSGFGVGICLMILAVFVAYFAVYGIIELCSRHRRAKVKAKTEIVEKVEGNVNV
ncbi:MAG: hypothetical protein ACI4R8_03170 [Candidatus Caccovivens sp.]